MSVASKQFQSFLVISFCGFFFAIKAAYEFFLTSYLPLLVIGGPAHAPIFGSLAFGFSSIRIIETRRITKVINSIIQSDTVNMINLFWHETVMPHENEPMGKVYSPSNAYLEVSMAAHRASFLSSFSSIGWWIFPKKRSFLVIVEEMSKIFLSRFHPVLFILGAA